MVVADHNHRTAASFGSLLALHNQMVVVNSPTVVGSIQPVVVVELVAEWVGHGAAVMELWYLMAHHPSVHRVVASLLAL